MKKIAIITGASSGLGVKFAEKVTQRYGTLDEIWIIARRKERLEQFAETHKEVNIRPIALDLTKETQLDELAALLEKEKPNIKVLINNAGYCKCGAFAEMDSAESDKMIMLNILAFTRINHLCLPYMHKGSYAILTCSVSSFTPIPYQAVYAASKAYVRFLGYALHREVAGRGVNILTLCPGNMDTEMNVKGDSGKSKYDFLPYLNLDKLTEKCLAKAENGCGFYTPGLFYKLYRLMCGIVPPAIMTFITQETYKENK